MKKTLALSILFLLVGYPLAAAAQALGLVHLAVANYPALIAGFAVVGLLAILAADYAPRTPPPTTRRSAKRAPRRTEPAAWTLHTSSA